MSPASILKARHEGNLKTIGKKTLRKWVTGVLEFKDLGTQPDGPVEVNDVVDPSAAETDPINPSFSPQNKAEFDVATRNLVKDLPNDQMPGIYNRLKSVVDDQLAAAADEEQQRQAEKSGTPMKSKSGINVEEAVRLAVRKMIAEAPATEKTQEPSNSDEMEFQDMARELGYGNKVHSARHEYGRAIDKMRFLQSLQPNEREHLIGSAFDDYVADIDDEKEVFTPDDFKWFTEKHKDVVDEYVKLLVSAGDLTAGDVMLLRDHPQIVVEQPGFKAFFLDNYEDEARGLPSFTEYLHDYVKSAMRGQKIETPTEGTQKRGVVTEDKIPSVVVQVEETADDLGGKLVPELSSRQTKAYRFSTADLALRFRQAMRRLDIKLGTVEGVPPGVVVLVTLPRAINPGKNGKGSQEQSYEVTHPGEDLEYYRPQTFPEQAYPGGPLKPGTPPKKLH